MRKSHISTFTRLPSWLIHVLPIGVLLVLQLVMVLARDQPLTMADEAGYLANARYLAGVAPMPTFYGAHYYPFGLSLFLVPAFWLFDNPHHIYTASLAIGTLLVSTHYVSLYYVLKALLGVSARLALIAALIVSLYPPILLRSNFAWAEVAYVPGYMLLIALFGVLLRQKTVRAALGFGLLLGFMYTIHSRSLPLIPLSTLYLLLLGTLRHLPWRTVCAAPLAAAGVFVATRAAVGHLRSAGGSEVSEILVGPVIAHLLSVEGLQDLLLKMNEQVLYLVLSTYGLVPIGFLAAASLIWQQRQRGVWALLGNVRSSTLIFFAFGWLGTLALTSVFMGSIKDEAQSILGRFVDGNSSVFLALGLIAIVSSQRRWPMWVSVAVLAIFASSTLAATYSLPSLIPHVFEPGVYAYFALLGYETSTLFLASLTAAGGYLIFSLVRGRIRYIAVAAIASLFLLFSAYGYFFAILPLQDRVARTTSLAAYIRAYLGSPPAIAYDTSSYHPLTYFTYEYLLPHTRFIPFDGSVGDEPPAPVVIGSTRWPGAEPLDARFWQAEPAVPLVGADQALWTLPGPEQSALLQGVDYTNTVLGRPNLPAWSIDTQHGRLTQTAWGVWQHSFHHPPSHVISETAAIADTIDTSLVWLEADAAMRIPYETHPPQALLLNFINPSEAKKPLRVAANGETLFDGQIPHGNWCQAFPLPAAPGSISTIEFSRQTWEPLLVRGITLLDHVPDLRGEDLSTEPLTPSGYRSRLTLATPGQSQSLHRGAMGVARLTVANASDQAWPTECELGNSPGVVKLGILWFPAHSSDRSLASRVAEGRAPLPYALPPGASLSLTAVLAPFDPDGNPLPAGDYVVWIGPVHETVSWFFQHGDEVLLLPVRVVR